MKEKKNIMKVIGLRKRYPEFFLNNISFHLESGKITGLIGANGMGKSTTIKLLLQIIKADDGEIYFQNRNILENKDISYKRKIGYVGENTDFFSQCRLNDIKKFYQSYYPDWIEDDYKVISNKLGIKSNYKMKDLSKGMRMKFNLCLALSHRPKLLLMDEPTSGLDPLVRNEVLYILKEQVRKYGTSILFSSHIIEDMEKIADYLIFIHQGKIIEQCEAKKILNQGISIDMYLENLIKQKGDKL